MRPDLYLDAEREWRKKEHIKSLRVNEQRRKEVVGIAWNSLKKGYMTAFDYIGICITTVVIGYPR